MLKLQTSYAPHVIAFSGEGFLLMETVVVPW